MAKTLPEGADEVSTKVQLPEVLMHPPVPNLADHVVGHVDSLEAIRGSEALCADEYVEGHVEVKQ